jgi:hypothetical protein
MTVIVRKPAINIREELSSLKKPTGVFGEQLMRSNTADEFYNVTGVSRNILINGGMEIWQRATSWADGSNDIYTADRWHFQRYAANGIELSRQSALDIGFNYCLRVARASGDAATTSYFINQPVEGLDSKKCRGKYVTFSFWVRSGVNHTATSFKSGIVIHSNVNFQNDGMFYQNFRNAASGEISIVDIPRNTSWKRIQQTVYVPTDIVQIGVAVYSDAIGTTAANDYFEVTGLQLEIGQVATPFEHRSQAQELALCQRYVVVLGGSSTNEVMMSGSGNVAGLSSQLYKPCVPFRTIPTLSYSALSDFQIQAVGVDLYTPTNITLISSISSPQYIYVDCNHGSTGTAGAVQFFRAANTNARLTFSAEL